MINISCELIISSKTFVSKGLINLQFTTVGLKLNLLFIASILLVAISTMLPVAKIATFLPSFNVSQEPISNTLEMLVW